MLLLVMKRSALSLCVMMAFAILADIVKNAALAHGIGLDAARFIGGFANAPATFLTLRIFHVPGFWTPPEEPLRPEPVSAGLDPATLRTPHTPVFLHRGKFKE